MRQDRLRRRPSILCTASMVFLVFLAVFVAGCGGEEEASSSENENNASVEEQEVAETTAESAEEPVASLGEPVTVGDAQWTVTDAEPLDQLVSRLGTDEGSFVITEVTFVNNSNQDVSLATPFLTLVDSEGREFEVDIENNFTHIEPDQNMFIEPVKPGATKEGMVIFAVAPDASGFELRAGDTTDFLSEKYGYIDLGF